WSPLPQRRSGGPATPASRTRIRAMMFSLIGLVGRRKSTGRKASAGILLAAVVLAQRRDHAVLGVMRLGAAGDDGARRDPQDAVDAGIARQADAGKREGVVGVFAGGLTGGDPLEAIILRGLETVEAAHGGGNPGG